MTLQRHHSTFHTLRKDEHVQKGTPSRLIGKAADDDDDDDVIDKIGEDMLVLHLPFAELVVCNGRLLMLSGLGLGLKSL